MKRLTLMRHADARWNDPAISDLERPLNRRGIGAAQAMARRLLELQLIPDLLLTSPARRAQQTADIVHVSSRCLPGACGTRRRCIWRAQRTC